MLLFTLACTGAEPELEPHFDDPASEGSFTPVTRELQVGELTLQTWHPSEQADRGSISDYDGVISGIARTQGDPWCPEPLPVVVFSHGNTGIRWQSLFLTETLAAHGYLVVAPDHVNNTLYDIDDELRPEVAVQRPQAVMDAFEALADDEVLGACVDPEAGYAVMGHSFGGYTTLAITGAQVDTEGLAEACAVDGDPFLCGLEELVGPGFADLSDARAWAGVPITPVGAITFGPEGLSHVQVPTLLIGAERDTATTMEEQILPIHEGLVDDELATFLGAGHFSFSVMCDLTTAANGCEDDFTPVEQVQAGTNLAVLSFLGRERGFEVAWPPDAPEVTWD
jgi:predicted dienelactone hydrolase